MPNPLEHITDGALRRELAFAESDANATDVSPSDRRLARKDAAAFRAELVRRLPAAIDAIIARIMETPVVAEVPTHLKRCDASPFGAPCVCPNAPHTLRFLGDNVVLNRSQWETLREQMLDSAPDAKRIDSMLNDPRPDRPMICPDKPCGETDMTRYTGTGCQHLAAESPAVAGISACRARACRGCPSAHACQYGAICRWPAGPRGAVAD